MDKHIAQILASKESSFNNIILINVVDQDVAFKYGRALETKGYNVRIHWGITIYNGCFFSIDGVEDERSLIVDLIYEIGEQGFLAGETTEALDIMLKGCSTFVEYHRFTNSKMKDALSLAIKKANLSLKNISEES